MTSTIETHQLGFDDLRPTPQEQIEAARRERDMAFNLTEEADKNGWDKKVIDQAIEAFAGYGEPFSANQLRELLPEVRSSLMGSRFYAASVRGVIKPVGSVTSTKRNTHAKPVALWVGAHIEGSEDA